MFFNLAISIVPVQALSSYYKSALYIYVHTICVYISTLLFFSWNETKIYLTTMFLRTKCFHENHVRMYMYLISQTSISRNIENTISETLERWVHHAEKKTRNVWSPLIVYFKWVKMYAHILHFVFVWIMYWKIVWKIAPP